MGADGTDDRKGGVFVERPCQVHGRVWWGRGLIDRTLCSVDEAYQARSLRRRSGPVGLVEGIRGHEPAL